MNEHYLHCNVGDSHTVATVAVRSNSFWGNSSPFVVNVCMLHLTITEINSSLHDYTNHKLWDQFFYWFPMTSLHLFVNYKTKMQPHSS